MLQDNYNGYKNGLAQLGLDDLDSRRKNLCLDFAKKCAKSEKMCHMFPKNTKNHNMDTRNNEVYMVQHANTGRLQNSSIIYMQKLLNSEEQKKLRNRFEELRFQLEDLRFQFEELWFQFEKTTCFGEFLGVDKLCYHCKPCNTLYHCNKLYSILY